MNTLVLYVGLFVAGVLLTRYLLHRTYVHNQRPLPPGPPSYPIIGQLFSMPSQSEHHAFTNMGKELGTDVFSLSCFGTTIVVLNSAEAASDLLEKRAGSYSGRFVTTMISSPLLLNLQNFVAFMDPTERWKKYRRVMHARLNKQAVVEFHAPQLQQVRLMLHRLLEAAPHLDSIDAIEEEFHRTIASTLLDSVYGYQLETTHDPFAVNATKFSDNLGKAMAPSNFLVNIIPWLVYVPDWVPGTSWKRVAREWRAENDHAIDSLYNWTKCHINTGADDHSILASASKEAGALGWSQADVDDYLKNLGMGIYAAGGDTSINALLSFILAMVLFPDVQAKAQQEIDAVLGVDRLPAMGDLADLPYVERLIYEVLRWQSPAPAAIPHICTQEDEYRGYRIPKGAIMFGNLWAMTRDEKVYKDPESVNPDRYLEPNVPFPPTFGWGRRACPGSHYAQATLFMIMASVLATFKIELFKDKDGHDILPSTEAESNSVRYRPKSFKCRIVPRSDLHMELIRNGV